MHDFSSFQNKFLRKYKNQSNALVTNLQLTSSLNKVFQKSLEINDNLPAEGQTGINTGSHYDTIKHSFEIFPKGMVYKKEHIKKRQKESQGSCASG